MKNTRENDKKWIEALQERNRVLEEVLALTQLENKKLTEQLRIADVTKRYYLTKDRQGNYQLLNELAYEKKLIYG